MTKKLSDKLGDVFVTTNPQSSGLAGETIYYSGDTSGWKVIGGVTQQDGWALCNGAEVTQADYPDLFEAIGTSWNFGGETGFRLPTIPDVVGTGNNAVAIVALYNNVASVVSTRDLSVNKLSIDEDLTVGTSLTVGTTAVIPDLTVNGTLTADAVISNSGETVSDILGEVKASVLTEMQFQSLKGTGWVLANGDEISREMYADLFNLIGTTYGPGDGLTTFNLPDLRERYIRGASGEEGMTSNDLGASNNDTTSVANIAVVDDSSIKSFSGAQTMSGAGAQNINASTNGQSSNSKATNNAGAQNMNANTTSFIRKTFLVSNSNISGSSPFALAVPGSSNAYSINFNSPSPSVLEGGGNNYNRSITFNNVSVVSNTGVSNVNNHTHNVNIAHNHTINVNNVNNHVHNDITGSVDINHGHSLTGDSETAPKSVVLNYFIKIA